MGSAHQEVQSPVDAAVAGKLWDGVTWHRPVISKFNDFTGFLRPRHEAADFAELVSLAQAAFLNAPKARVGLRQKDAAGLFTFDTEIRANVAAKSNQIQLTRILSMLDNVGVDGRWMQLSSPSPLYQLEVPLISSSGASRA